MQLNWPPFNCCFLLQVGQLVPLDPKGMFMSVLQLVLAPVLLGCTINTLLPGLVSGCGMLRCVGAEWPGAGLAGPSG